VFVFRLLTGIFVACFSVRQRLTLGQHFFSETENRYMDNELGELNNKQTTSVTSVYTIQSCSDYYLEDIRSYMFKISLFLG
jgi:hypothetical protein